MSKSNGITSEDRLLVVLDDLKHEIERLNDNLEELDDREVQLGNECRRR